MKIREDAQATSWQVSFLEQNRGLVARAQEGAEEERGDWANVTWMRVGRAAAIRQGSGWCCDSCAQIDPWLESPSVQVFHDSTGFCTSFT